MPQSPKVRQLELTFHTRKLTTIYTEFHDIDPEVMLKSLNILVKRGKAQIFGSDDEKGVKFF